jgi:hypothetical protein
MTIIRCKIDRVSDEAAYAPRKGVSESLGTITLSILPVEDLELRILHSSTKQSCFLARLILYLQRRLGWLATCRDLACSARLSKSKEQLIG